MLLNKSIKKKSYHVSIGLEDLLDFSLVSSLWRGERQKSYSQKVFDFNVIYTRWVHSFDLGKYYGEDDDCSAASGEGIISSSTASSGIIRLPTNG